MGKNSVKKIEQDKKNKIEAIVNKIEDELNLQEVEDFEKSVQQYVGNFDHIEVEKQCESEADEFLEGILLTFSTIKKTDMRKDYFLRGKINEDKKILTMLKFQVELANYSTKKLAENIVADQTYFRNYEQLRSMQTSILDIVKHIIQLERIMEDFYKSYFLEKNQEKGTSLPEVAERFIDNEFGYYKGLKVTSASKLLDEIDEDEDEDNN